MLEVSYCVSHHNTVNQSDLKITGVRIMAVRTANRGPAHPGVHVWRNVIPKGMTVTKAASLLGVGRPALSNFLHGKSALSQEMALRLKQTFGADRERLLDLQAQYDRRDDALKAPVVSGRHVPVLAEIKAQQIEQWSNTTRAREELPALLRRLVCATLGEATRVDFPAFDNAQRPGWDGIVETAAPSPWVPEGRSCWEFGCATKPGTKASSDYAKRTKGVSLATRLESVFVFVTSRNWWQKNEWAAEKAALQDWKDVCAYDASDLEQWLEQSAETQVWFAARLNVQVDGVRSPEQCWSGWADACEPALPSSLFSVVEGDTTKLKELKEWLGAPPERPFIVVADSPQEALAFACHSISKVGNGKPGTSALVVDTPEVMRKLLSTNSAPKIAIIHDSQVEREIGNLFHRCHCLIVRLASGVAPEIKPDIRLELPTREDFLASLKSMGYNQDKIDRLARESGRSPTVLRRRLSGIPAVREPAWTGTAKIARKLLPAALVGAWNEAHTADCKIVRKLARKRNYEKIETGINELLRLEEPPLWSAGNYQGVVSRVDALFGIAEFVTKSDLNTFFSCAERVLAERDPALDLPEDQRWVAAAHGKVRIHSTALREGISDTLVLLSVYGNGLFRERLGIDVESRVSSLIRKLLEPFTIDILLSQDMQLPRYAEAAPEAFLNLIKADLDQKPEPIVFGLLKPSKDPLFSGCPRTGLLWALEFLAWRNVDRASEILARLSEVEISDNFAHTPFASLKGIHLSWMPQTAALLEERLHVFENLMERYPRIGWRLSMEQLKSDFQTASHNYRPRWRDDASGFGRVTTYREMQHVRRKAFYLALNRPEHDPDSLADLIEHLAAMPTGSQNAVWVLIDKWMAAEADDRAKAKLRERIRRSLRFWQKSPQGVSSSTRNRARATCAKLEPSDPVARHAWLFDNHWVHHIGDNDRDFAKREKKIQNIRSLAIRAIWRKRGMDGVMELIFDSRTSRVVGHCVGRNITNTGSLAIILDGCLSTTRELRKKADECVEGLLSSVDDETCCNLLETIADGADTDQVVRIFQCAPARQSTWKLLEQYGKKAISQYWRKIVPPWHTRDDADLNEMIRCLLNSKRPRAAFNAVRFDWSRIETELLMRLLEDVRTVAAEPDGEYLLDRHEISDALETLDGRLGITPDIMANLEFLYVDALDKGTRGIPNLERKIAKSPEFFVQILAAMYDRDDGQIDPPEIRIDSQERRMGMFSAARRIFDQINRIPGTTGDGRIDTNALQNWVSEARRLCAEFGRAKIGDHYIGGLLAKAPVDEGELWPCKAVCDVMENTVSEEIGRSFRIGTINQRGVYSRSVGDGGAQEHEFAEKYRLLARQRRIDYPYVGRVLEGIAASYDDFAAKEDDRAKVDKRLRY